MSIDKRIDAVQKVSTVIAKLCTEDAEKVIAFATALKNGQQISSANDLQVLRIFCGLDETFAFTERMLIMLEYLLKYFSIREQDMTAESKHNILENYDRHGLLCEIAFDYAIRIKENCDKISDSLKCLEHSEAKEQTE